MNYRYAARKEVQAAILIMRATDLTESELNEVRSHLRKAEDLLTPPSHKDRKTHEFRRFGTFAAKKGD